MTTHRVGFAKLQDTSWKKARMDVATSYHVKTENGDVDDAPLQVCHVWEHTRDEGTCWCCQHQACETGSCTNSYGMVRRLEKKDSMMGVAQIGRGRAEVAHDGRSR